MKSSLALVAMFGCAAALAGPPEFEPPFRVSAGDEWIDVDIGHAAPWVADWNGDGKNDLLVGQFGDGKMRIYRNVGSNAEPKFDSDFAWFQTRKGLGSIPSG
ncbi:MAG: hypothetical protein IT430_18220 [Phycisphaerales bacterium]|nr:hypothetical protein [Phycisphaerales bacterium]